MAIIDYYFASMLEKITGSMICGWILVSAVSGLICRHLYRKQRISKHKAIAITLMVAYLYFVFCITLSGRTSGSDYAYKLRPFWSWRMIVRGEKKLIAELRREIREMKQKYGEENDEEPIWYSN